MFLFFFIFFYTSLSLCWTVVEILVSDYLYDVMESDIINVFSSDVSLWLWSQKPHQPAVQTFCFRRVLAQREAEESYVGPFQTDELRSFTKRHLLQRSPRIKKWSSENSLPECFFSFLSSLGFHSFIITVTDYCKKFGGFRMQPAATVSH